MATPSNSVSFWAVPYGTSTVVAVGSVMLPDTSGGWLVSTAANRTAIGRRSEGIAVTSYGGSGLGSVEIWQTGTIDATVSGLAAGSASWVRASTAGIIERCVPSGSDDIIGYAEADGRVHLIFGIFTPAMVSTGGSGAPTTSSYVTMALDGSLSAERVLTAGTGINIIDGGANSTVTIANTGAPVGATYLTLSNDGTLTNERVLTAGTNVTFSDSGANGTLTINASGGGGGAPTTASYLTLALDGTLTNERVLTAGTNITFTDTGANGTLTINAAGGGGFTPPTGSGLMTVTTGSMNAASLAWGANNTVFTSNGTVGSWNLLVNANISATANIDITKLGAGTTNFVARTNGSGTATEWALITDSNINAAAAIQVSKITMPGSSGQPIYSTGSGGCAAATNWSIGTGLTGSTSSFVSVASYLETPKVRWNSTHTLLDSDSTNGYLFTDNTFNNQINTGRIYAASEVILGLGSQTAIDIQSSLTRVQARAGSGAVIVNQSTIDTSLPFGGSVSDTVPFRYQLASLTMTAGVGTATTPAASVYSCPIIEVTTTADGQQLILPSVVGAVFHIRVVAGGNSSLLIRKVAGSGGVTMSTPTNHGITVYYSSAAADYVAMSAQV